jgi:hypothetical protein
MLIMFTSLFMLVSLFMVVIMLIVPNHSLVTNVPFCSSHSMLQNPICVCFFLNVGARDPFYLSYSCSSLLLIKFMALLTMFLLFCFHTGILNAQFLLHIMVVFLPIHHFVYGLLMFVILLFVFIFMISFFT